jgi:phosphopantothenoylcysteine decarboxylase/phosphopantothenate--cysteine ligase
MGYAIASAAAVQGASVILISGPVNIPEPLGINTVIVESAEEMYAATHEVIDDADIFISAAAVADYRPTNISPQKIKKSNEGMGLELVR